MSPSENRSILTRQYDLWRAAAVQPSRKTKKTENLNGKWLMTRY